jgi:hypothetical protein
MEGESGTIKTDLGNLKPICGTGTIKGAFTKSTWWVDVGTQNDPIDVQIACKSALSTTGYIKARPNGITAAGGFSRSLSDGATINFAELAKVTFTASASMSMQMKIKVRFDQSALSGSVYASADASVSVDVDPIGENNSYHVNLASVGCGGTLSFKVDTGICMSGALKGNFTIIGKSIDLNMGIKVNNGSVSFPSNPSPCN